MNVQKTFTKIRSILNEREDELLLNIDKNFDNIFLNENLIFENEKLPDKIKILLEKSKNAENEWNDKNKLNIIINDCINIENNINNINIIKEKLKKCKDNDSEVIFSPNEKEFNEFLKKVKSFGEIKIINNNDNNQFIKSVIMQKDEFYFIKSEIKNKLNKKIKEIKKLYQATVDGGEPLIFI